MLVLYIILIVNIFTFCIYALDKVKAIKNKWRIPESTLIILAFLMGSIGAIFGMLLCNHKINKLKFRLLLPLAFCENIMLGYFLWQWIV